MNRQFHNKRQSLTNKPVWTNYSTDQKNFTGHMFNIKLEQKSYKMKFKDLPAKIQQSKTNMGEERGGGHKVRLIFGSTRYQRITNFLLSDVIVSFQ